MINNSEFSERLKKIMEFYQLSASGFADRIQVPRSSISHLLSGRNKPSLDFVMKVVKEFNQVELYWLLNGKGSFPLEESPILEKEIEQLPKKEVTTIQESNPLQEDLNSNEIERIVIFYKNGKFKEYLK